jgi:Cu+-exporting ATPase
MARITIPVVGMTCASCVGRVERAVEKVPGVLDVTVNLGTEKSTVEYLAGEVDVGTLERAIEGAGYGVVREEETSVEDAHEREYRKLEGNFLLAVALTALILLGSLPQMLGLAVPVSMTLLNFGLLALATPIVGFISVLFVLGETLEAGAGTLVRFEEKERQLLQLYPQPRGRHSGVEYFPGRPEPPGLPPGREVPRPKPARTTKNAQAGPPPGPA